MGPPAARGAEGGVGAAEAEDHIQEAMLLEGAIGLDAIYTHLAAALTSLQLDDRGGDYERGRASPPPPNALEIAALVDRRRGSCRKSWSWFRWGLLGAKRSNRVLGRKCGRRGGSTLHTLITAAGGGRQGGSLANLRNLLEEAAQGVAVLVGECPHRVAEALQ